MNERWFQIALGGTIGMLTALEAPAFDPVSETRSTPQDKIQKIRFREDDDQNYMVSKVYELKHVKANDLVPFVLGAVKRYSSNSTADRINYTSEKQWIAVTTGIRMMPYVDDMIAKLDRPSAKRGPYGSLLDGTGIQRYVYTPKYRSSQEIVDLMISTGIPANATTDRKQDAVVKYDEATNLIYWKDSERKSSDLVKYITWLDRPLPQVSLTFRVYEVRESTMRDLGADYLAWKNGPGLNLFQTGWDVFSLSSGGTAALQAMSGPAGGFFFAPQFDASFLRVLQQSGNADIRNTANLTVSNSDSKSYELLFNPQFQNIAKSDNDKTSVTLSAISSLPEGANQVYLKIINPIVNLHGGIPQAGYPASEAFSLSSYTPGSNAKRPGTLFFGYNVQTASVVERNNVGSELIETGTIQGNTLIELNKEVILAQWDKDQEVEQTIGVPFLAEIPVLKYLFSTTTTSREKTRFYLTVRAEILDTAPRKNELDA